MSGVRETVTMAPFPQHKPSEIQSWGTQWGDGERTTSHIFLEKIKCVMVRDGHVYLNMWKQGWKVKTAVKWLTNTLVGCHARQLWRRPHGTEHLRAWSRGAHGTLHVLEIWSHIYKEACSQKCEIDQNCAFETRYALLTLWPDTLGRPAWARAQLSHLPSCWVVSTPVLGLWDGCHEVARGRSWLVGIDDWVRHCAHTGHSLHILVGQVCLTLLFALGQSDVQRLCGHDASVHLGHGFGGLLWGGEADKAESFAAATFQHDLRVTELNT